MAQRPPTRFRSQAMTFLAAILGCVGAEVLDGALGLRNLFGAPVRAILLAGLAAAFTVGLISRSAPSA
jgi:hypothetical protein